jgi:hypothetical protein
MEEIANIEVKQTNIHLNTDNNRIKFLKIDKDKTGK